MDPTLFFIVAVFTVIGLLVFADGVKTRAKEKRRQALMLKYGDAALVERIMGQKVWTGQTQGMLLDSWGQPEDVDIKVLKTKRKEIWKYGQTGRGRFRNRVTVENGFVVGFDIK